MNITGERSIFLINWKTFWVLVKNDLQNLGPKCEVSSLNLGLNMFVISIGDGNANVEGFRDTLDTLKV